MLRIIDNAVPAEFATHIAQLPEMEINLPHWWVSGQEPERPEHHLILYLYSTYAKELFDIPPVGYEYWHRGIVAGDIIPVHQDCDEQMKKRHKKVVTPQIASVFYYANDEMEGGDLLLFDSPQSKEPVAIEPKHNRWVIFQGDFYHGVSPVLSGKRRSLAINFWPKPISNADKLHK